MRNESAEKTNGEFARGMRFHFQTRTGNDSVERDQPDDQQQNIRLVVKTQSDHESRQRTHSEHVQTGFYPQKNQHQSKKRTDHRASEKEKQLRNRVNRYAFGNQDVK